MVRHLDAKTAPPRQLHFKRQFTPTHPGFHRLFQRDHGETFQMDLCGSTIIMLKRVTHLCQAVIVCVNSRQARKDAQDRQAIIESHREKIRSGAKEMIGNKGYRRFVKVESGSFSIDTDKVEEEARFDGTWVLRTNTKFSPKTVALKYKQLWMVEHAFRDMKSVFETRPVFHQRDETIRGHVFCSFLALVLRKELYRRLEMAGHGGFEWSEIKQDLEALQEITIDDNGKKLAIRSQCLGTCGKVFQAVGVAIPPTIRERSGS